MKLRVPLAGMVIALLVAVGASGPAEAEPLRLRYAVWPGFGPLFVAQEKGFFAEEGVQVELIEIEEHTAAFAGFFAGHVDALLGTLPDTAASSQPGDEPLGCVLMFDQSFGGDGVLTTKDIHSIADLKGKSVAVLHASVSEFYLNVLLNKAGLTESDIEVVDLSAEDGVTALMLQEVDAAMTWEPWLSQGKGAEHVHLLTDSSQQPGLLVDCLITTASIFRERKSEFQGLARAWFAGLDYIEAHPDEAMAIMARTTGGGLEGPEFAKTLEVIRFYDKEANKTYFGTPDTPGPIYGTAQQAIEVFSRLGILKFDLSPSDVVIYGILGE